MPLFLVFCWGWNVGAKTQHKLKTICATIKTRHLEIKTDTLSFLTAVAELVNEAMVKEAGLLRLEHITATFNIHHQRRGNIAIDLESPNSIKSELATRRSNMGVSGDGNWEFMTIKGH